MKLKYNKLFLLLVSIFIILFCILSYFYFSKVKFFQPVNISIQGITHYEASTIKIEFITPTNKKYGLPLDNKNNSWQYWYSYSKSLKVIIDNTIFSKVKLITIQIGKAIYKYDNSSFKNNWKSKRENNILYFESPDNVRGSQSKLFMLFSVFFWGGEFSELYFTLFCPYCFYFYFIGIYIESF